MTAKPSRPPDRIVTACDERQHAVLRLIRGAQSRISLSLFRCNDKLMFAELARAVDRGVNVEVLMTSRAKGGKRRPQKLWAQLEATGASVSAYNDAVVKYHAKYLVIDEGPALVASLNFTKKCFGRTCDAMLITHDPEVVKGLRALMQADREGRPAPASLPARLIVGPEGARRQFTALLEQATTSIRLIDAKLADPGLLALLNARRAAGVRVETHSDSHVAGMKSHGKIMLIDGKRAVVGSIALAALSLDFRREVAVPFDDPAAVAEIERLFRSIGAAAGSAGRTPAATAGGA